MYLYQGFSQILKLVFYDVPEGSVLHINDLKKFFKYCITYVQDFAGDTTIL